MPRYPPLSLTTAHKSADQGYDPIVTSTCSESVRGRMWRSRRGSPMGGRGSYTPVPLLPLFIFRGSVAGGTYLNCPFVKEVHSPCSPSGCRLLPPQTSPRETKGGDKEISGLNTRTIPVAAYCGSAALVIEATFPAGSTFEVVRRVVRR
jgi:hypothetical protein